jgi:hypothetical protein
LTFLKGAVLGAFDPQYALGNTSGHGREITLTFDSPTYIDRIHFHHSNKANMPIYCNTRDATFRRKYKFVCSSWRNLARHLVSILFVIEFQYNLPCSMVTCHFDILQGNIIQWHFSWPQENRSYSSNSSECYTISLLVIFCSTSHSNILCILHWSLLKRESHINKFKSQTTKITMVHYLSLVTKLYS